MSTYDDELPAGYQDADIEMRELAAHADELENEPPTCNCNARGNVDHEMGSAGCAYAETPAEELGRLRRELSELGPDTPEHRDTLDRIAVLVREQAERRMSEGHDITTAAGRRARSIARQDARLLATGNATYPPNTPIEVKTSGYEFAHGKKPSGTGTWAFQLGDDDRPENTYWFTGRYTDGRKAAMRAARWRGKDTIEVLP